MSVGGLKYFSVFFLLPSYLEVIIKVNPFKISSLMACSVQSEYFKLLEIYLLLRMKNETCSIRMCAVKLCCLPWFLTYVM